MGGGGVSGGGGDGIDVLNLTGPGEPHISTILKETVVPKWPGILTRTNDTTIGQ